MMRGHFLFLLVILFILTAIGCSTGTSWREASRASAGIAPDPATTEEAVLQVYGADAWGWRGWFAIHTWIAAKHTGEEGYYVYEVVGWRSRHGLPVVRIAQDIPDRYWFGARPVLLAEYRGTDVDRMIRQVDEAARSYPWKTTYQAVPGPNSNTFTAWVVRQVPGLDLDLPWAAIGSGYAEKADQFVASRSLK